MNSQGVFYQQPNASDGAPLAPLEVTLFNNAFDKDKFESTSWTLNGKVGPLKAVYTGGYLVRNVEQVGDYTNYARGVYADYYQCYGPGSAGDPNLKPTCYSPSATWFENERNTHQQHEIRFSTPDDWRLRGIVGAFWEDNTLCDQGGWNYKTVPSCTTNDPAGTAATAAASRTSAPRRARRVAEPRRTGRQHSFYQDTMRADEADRLLRLVRLRHHSEGVDHHRRHAPFPLRQLLGGQRLWRVSTASRRRTVRRLPQRQLQPERAESQGHRVRLQEPRQHHLAHHAGPHGVLHVLPGLPPRWIQPERRHGARPDATAWSST